MIEPLLYTHSPHHALVPYPHPHHPHPHSADGYKLGNSSFQMQTSPSIAIPSSTRREQVYNSMSPSSPSPLSCSASSSSSPDTSPSTSPTSHLQITPSSPSNIGALAIQFKKRKRGRPPLEKDSRHCSNCGTNSTPEWRKGPNGPHTLCNACGLQFMKAQKRERQAKDKQSIFRVLNGEASRQAKKFTPLSTSDPLPRTNEGADSIDPLSLVPSTPQHSSLHNSAYLEALQSMSHSPANSIGTMSSLSNSMSSPLGSMSSLSNSMTLVNSMHVPHPHDMQIHNIPIPNDLYSRVHASVQHPHPHSHQQLSHSPTSNGGMLEQQLQQYHLQQMQMQHYQQQLHQYHQFQQMQFYNMQQPPSGNGHM